MLKTGSDLSKEKKGITILTYLSFLIVSVLFMLAFSLWTSPHYKNWYGCDASFFTLVGRGMLNGKIPYRDFYDLKGPYFFFIQALGQLICRGRTGIFIVQIIALFLSLILIYRIARLYISHKKALGTAAFFLWPYVSMLWGGNCLEEFFLPVNLLGIYLNLKLVNTDPLGNDNTDDQEKLTCITGMISGICFLVMAFGKITAGAPVAGIVLGVFILYLVKKKYKPLAFYLLYFMLGAFIAFLPLIIYYGYYGSILQMLYCTFIFGFKRSSDLTHIFSLDLEVKLSGVIFSIVFLVLHAFGKRGGRVKPDAASDNASNNPAVLPKELIILLLPMSLVTYLVLHLGDAFIYYFITEMPCLIVTLILFLKLYDPLILFKTLKQSVCWMVLFVFVFHFTKESLDTVKMFIYESDSGFQAEYYNDAKNMGALIPDCDRNSVFSFDIDMQWYEINNILPCNRYPINLQYFIALEPSIEQDLFDFLENTPPKWMICSNTLEDYLPQMNEIVQEKYDLLYSTETGLVYLLKE